MAAGSGTGTGGSGKGGTGKGGTGKGGTGKITTRALVEMNKLLKDNAHLLNQGLDIQKQINDETLKYNEVVKTIKKNKKDIQTFEEMSKKIVEENKKNYKDNLELVDKINNAIKAGDKDEAKRLKNIKKDKESLLIDNKKELKILKNKIDLLNQENAIYTKNLKRLNEFKRLTSQISDDFKSMGGALKTMGGYIQQGYNSLKGWGLFEMQKSIKTSAMQMGILSNQAQSFSQNIQNIALDTIEFGAGIKDVAELQASYSDSLGRTVQLGKDAGTQMMALAKATGLGNEGAAELAANMDAVGKSAKETANYVEQTMDDASSMGLNSTKVVRNLSQNIKMLNKYNFKNGAKGLAKMAQETTKMGVSMDMVAGMADKLFDIEGAVEMSAQLQVLGGEWASLADPFKLMYMARNDMKGLTESVINATKSTAQFNAETGEFDIASLEMQRLRKVAEATGLNFEELAKSAKMAAKFAAIKGQVSLDVDEKTEKFIENTAYLNKDKKAVIMVKGDEKLVSTLDDADKSYLKNAALQKESMVERAKSARSFDEVIDNTITMAKQLLLPIVEVLSNDLTPVIDSFVKSLKDPKTLETIKGFAEGVGHFAVWVGKLIGSIGEFVFKHPVWSAALFGVFEAGKWFLNGKILGAGFNSVASVGKGLSSGIGQTGKMLGGGVGRGALGALGAGAAGYGISALSPKDSMLGQGLGGALQGAGMGAMFGPWGALAGAIIGGVGGIISANMEKDVQTGPTVGTNDGVMFNPKDKFTKLDDGTMIAGTNVNGNKQLAQALTSMAPTFGGGSVSNTSNTYNQSSGPGMLDKIDVKVDDIAINGRIELALGQNMSSEIGDKLLSNPLFIRNISLLVNKAVNSAVSGKNK